MSGVSQRARDEVIYYLRRAHREGQVSAADTEARIEVAQQTQDPTRLAGLVADLPKVKLRRQDAQGYLPPPSEPGPTPAEVARIERRAARLRRRDQRWERYGKMPGRSRLEALPGVLIGIIVALGWTTSRFMPDWMYMMVLVGLMAGGAMISLTIFDVLHRWRADRLEARTQQAALEARRARAWLKKAPRDEYRSDAGPAGASPTPAPPRDGFNSDAPR